MGNFMSCVLSTPVGKQRTMRVVFPSGEVRQFYNPIKAAELMLETPNFFLVNSKSLHIGKRFSALNADEDLEFANLYIMFPMKRMRSIITAVDLGPLFLAANSKSRHRRAENVNVKRLPGAEKSTEVAAAAPPLVVTLEEAEGLSLPELEFKRRLSMSKSKKPFLETIAEEPVGSKCSCIKL